MTNGMHSVLLDLKSKIDRLETYWNRGRVTSRNAFFSQKRCGTKGSRLILLNLGVAVGLEGTVPYLAACSELVLCCGYDLCIGVNTGLCGPAIGSLPVCTTDLARPVSFKRVDEQLKPTGESLLLTSDVPGIPSDLRNKRWWWH